MLIGYARISTTLQSMDAQVQALKRCGIDDRNIYKEQISAAAKKRPELEKALGFLMKGDTFMVTKLDRLARSLEHLIKLFNFFKENGIDFISLTEKIDTTTATGKMHFHMAAAFCEFERNLISERTREGLAAARASGKIFGRAPILTSQQKKMIDQFMEEGKSKYEIAKCIGIKSRTPIYNYLRLKEVINGRKRKKRIY